MPITRTLFIVAILTLSSLLLPAAGASLIHAAPPAQEVCPGNLLANPGFEHGFSTRERNEVVVANGWHPWWNNNPGADGFNYIPEYQPEERFRHGDRRIRSGNFAQKFFTSFSTHTAGFFQRVTVPRGSQVTFSIWVQVWSSNQDNPNVSNEPGNYRVQVGIHPSGDTNPFSPEIVWSDPVARYDDWLQLRVSTTATGDAITVFTRGQPEFRVKHNDSYWDDACLTAAAPAPTPTPIPTDTPVLVDTPTPTETPIPVDTPTPTPTDTPEAAPTSTPTDTPLPPPTDTPTPEATATATPTPVPTRTPLPPDLIERVNEAVWADGRPLGSFFLGAASILVGVRMLGNR